MYDLSERIALWAIWIYLAGILILPAHFYRGICATTWASGAELKGQVGCTGLASLLWPVVTPVEFSFWLF